MEITKSTTANGIQLWNATLCVPKTLSALFD
jgi:hypothetical protein